jgi:nucleolar complex protein 2
LQENGTELLEFDSAEESNDEGGEDEGGDEENEAGDDDGEEGSEDDEDGGGAASASAASAAPGAAAATVLTAAALKAVCAALSAEHSFRSLKKLLDMFRCGCLVSQPEAAANLPDARKYVVPSAAVFNALMVTALQRLHSEFAHHVPVGGSPAAGAGAGGGEGGSSGGEKLLAKHPKWKKLEPLALAFFKACLGLLGSVSEPSLLAFVLKQLRHYVPYMAPFPKVAKKYLKALLAVWGESQAPDAEARSVQIAAFFRLRQLAICMPFPCVEDCLKGLYLTYARNARFVNDQSLPVLTFMGNCVVELYGLELASSYQHAFVYVRQLAMLLRNALVKKTKDALQAVFNWQYLSCLRCWAAVVSAYPDQLSGLAYPLTQVTALLRWCACVHLGFRASVAIQREALKRGCRQAIPDF